LLATARTQPIGQYYADLEVSGKPVAARLETTVVALEECTASAGHLRSCSQPRLRRKVPHRDRVRWLQIVLAPESGVVKPTAVRQYRRTKAIPGTLQEGGAPFRTTHWSVVHRAVDAQSGESAQHALADFCQQYWPPLYAFLRHRGHSSNDAQDLTQAFILHLMEYNTLSRADRAKGRLRTFLLGSLQNFLANEHDRAQALKRGGGKQLLSLDENFADAEAAIVAAPEMDPTSRFDLAWASNVVKRAWTQLEEAFAAVGKSQWLEEMRPFLAGGTATPPPQDEVAARLGVPVATLRTSLMRLRQRYREALRNEVGRTVSDPTEIDEELQYLYRILTA
jgi:RNA polymerase sigma-70 factor (ECF subfamily)